MATHEVAAGLGFSADVVDLGVPVAAALGFSGDVSAAPTQTLELAATLGARFAANAQAGDQDLAVSGPLIQGSLTDANDRKTDVNVYRVVGLSRSILEGRRNEALNAPGVPLDGAAHPDPAMPGIQVISRQVDYEEGDQTRALVRVTYGPPTANNLEKRGGASGGGVLTLSPASYTESIWHDANGDLMVIEYQSIGIHYARTVEAEAQKKTWTATLTKEFDSPQYADVKRPTFINSAVFGPFAAQTLLFLSPTVNETDEGTYSHGYQFTYNPDTWKLRSSIWVSGFIPDDATENFNPTAEPGGLGVFTINGAFDFNTLPVWFP